MEIKLNLKYYEEKRIILFKNRKNVGINTKNFNSIEFDVQNLIKYEDNLNSFLNLLNKTIENLFKFWEELKIKYTGIFNFEGIDFKIYSRFNENI